MLETNPPTLWIIIKNWHRYQHYNPKIRVPPWIKLYTNILDDPDFLELTEHRRYIFLTLLTTYAQTRGRVQLDTRYLSRQLDTRVMRRDIESLNHAGFVTLTASKPLALDASDMLDHAQLARGEEKEQETHLPTMSWGDGSSVGRWGDDDEVIEDAGESEQVAPAVVVPLPGVSLPAVHSPAVSSDAGDTLSADGPPPDADADAILAEQNGDAPGPVPPLRPVAGGEQGSPGVGVPPLEDDPATAAIVRRLGAAIGREL